MAEQDELEDWKTIRCGDTPHELWACPPHSALSEIAGNALAAALLDVHTRLANRLVDVVETFVAKETHFEVGAGAQQALQLHILLAVDGERVGEVIEIEFGTLLSRPSMGRGVVQVGFRASLREDGSNR